MLTRSSTFWRRGTGADQSAGAALAQWCSARSWLPENTDLPVLTGSRCGTGAEPSPHREVSTLTIPSRRSWAIAVVALSYEGAGAVVSWERRSCGSACVEPLDGERQANAASRSGSCGGGAADRSTGACPAGSRLPGRTRENLPCLGAPHHGGVVAARSGGQATAGRQR